MITSVKLKRLTDVSGLEIMKERNSNYNPENSLITENWIPTQKNIIRKLKKQFKKTEYKFRDLYDWVNDDFIKKVKSEIGTNISNPVQFYVFHYLKTIDRKRQLAVRFRKGLYTWKDYRNLYEQTKGRMYMVRGLETLFRNIKTKEYERNNY